MIRLIKRKESLSFHRASISFIILKFIYIHRRNISTAHPSFAPYTLQLARGVFADALRAPQLQTDPCVRECHRSNWQNVRQHHEDHVVPGRRKGEFEC